MYDLSFAEQQVLSTLFGANNWISVACLICYFQVILFRPDRIRSKSLFFWAVLTLAASVVTPALSMIAAITLGSAYGMLSSDGGAVLGIVATIAAPLLTAISIVFAVVSILPRRVRTIAPAVRPAAAHPLD